MIGRTDCSTSVDRVPQRIAARHLGPTVRSRSLAAILPIRSWGTRSLQVQRSGRWDGDGLARFIAPHALVPTCIHCRHDIEPRPFTERCVRVTRCRRKYRGNGRIGVDATRCSAVYPVTRQVRERTPVFVLRWLRPCQRRLVHDPRRRRLRHQLQREEEEEKWYQMFHFGHIHV